MKDIRIFVASSKELERERNYLAYLVLAKAEEFERRGFRVRLSKWEYVDPKMTKERTEDRYLAEMYACDAALILFRNVAGMYTREEMDKALATEQAGTARLKAHRILFSEGADGNSDAAKLRASLPEGSYGTFRDFSDLREGFLALVERVAAMDGLAEVDEGGLCTVSAFLAADDELAADRNAFADMVLNLNDILARRGVRVKLRFYDSARHREMLESSEMALVLYRTNFNAFGPEQMREAYDRTKREENPRRLYVFFRDGDDITSDEEFAAFRDGFAENIGHFFCRFENADTLKLNFLLSLENALGEGASFVKLDGRRVMADNLEVGDLTSLPMVAKNEGLSSIMAELDALGARFAEQRRRCNEDPLNDALYGELMDLSVRKNELQQQVDRELALSLNLAKRMAAISVAEANDTIMRARVKMEEGRIKEAIEILDGASSSLRRRRILRRAEERVDEVAQEIKELAAGNEVEFFRVEAVMSYAGMPFNERFKKAESIYSMLAEDIETYSESCPPAHKLEVDAMLADILRRFAKLYYEVGDALKPIPLLEKALKLCQAIKMVEPDSCQLDVAMTLNNLAVLHGELNRLTDAERECAESLDIYRRLATDNPAKFDGDVARGLNNLAILHRGLNRIADAEREYAESLEIRRRLADDNPAKFDEDLAQGLNNLANLHGDMNRFADAEREYAESLDIYRRLAADNPTKFDGFVAGTLFNLANLHRGLNRFADAEREYAESLEIRRRLAVDNPAKFGGAVASVLNNLAGLHRHKDIAAAKEYLLEAQEILTRLAAQAPEKFQKALEGTKANLAKLNENLIESKGETK